MAGKKGGKPKAVKYIAAAIILAVIAVAVYFFTGGQDPGKKAARDASVYIDAVQKRDFDTVFKYNAVAQRRRAIISQRSTADTEAELKALFEGLKGSFDAAEPMSDLRAQWVEKWLFAPGAVWSVAGVETYLDTENPSQPASERLNALVTVKAEYPDKNSAPDLDGLVKSAEYRVMMIQARNVSRILREEVREKRWLFNSISVDRETIEYWPE